MVSDNIFKTVLFFTSDVLPFNPSCYHHSCSVWYACIQLSWDKSNKIVCTFLLLQETHVVMIATKVCDKRDCTHAEWSSAECKSNNVENTMNMSVIAAVPNRACVPRSSALSLDCSRKAGSDLSHFILLSNHKVRGPPGKKQSTKQHCVAEENEFEYFLESAEEADKQGLHIQIHIQRLVLLLRPRHLSHVRSPTHSARIKMPML